MNITISPGRIAAASTIYLANVRCDRFLAVPHMQLQFATHSLHYIASTVAAEFGLTVVDIKRQTKEHVISHPRLIAMALAAERGYPMREIAAYFALTHAAVIHARQWVKDMEETDPKLARRIAGLRELVKA